MAITHDAMRRIIGTACDAVGFPAPFEDTPLTEWADEALDDAMRRGSPQWQNAHAEVIAALECASLGDELGIRNALKRAQTIAVRVQRCLCKEATHAVESGSATWCVVCGGRK